MKPSLHEGPLITTSGLISAHSAGSGHDIASDKSTLLKRLKDLPPIRRIMIIDDSEQDCRHMVAALYLLLGRDVEISTFRNMAVAIDRLRREMPGLVFLDDYLPPLDRAESSIRSLQRFGFNGPVVIITGQMTRARRLELSRLGPLAVVDKDDINTTSLAEVLLRLLPGAN